MNTPISELLNRMSAIKDETQDNQNTATKIGQMLIDFLDSSIIKGKDESLNPANTAPNLWFLRQLDLFKTVLDTILPNNYLQRNMLYLTETGTTELSSSIEKLNTPATTEGQLQEKVSKITIASDETKYAISSMRMVGGGLQKNVCETTIGTSEEVYFQIKTTHSYTYDPDTTTYSVVDKSSTFKILPGGMTFSIDANIFLNVNKDGIFQNPASLPQFSQAGWVAPYQYVKNRMVKKPYSEVLHLDCAFYNSTMFYLDFVVGENPSTITIENLVDGAEIIILFKLKAEDGEIQLLGEFFSYFNLPNLANLTVQQEFDGGITNEAGTIRTFKLNGKCMYNYPEIGKKAILWEVFEFPNPIV